jgi:hypothetical protein
VVTPMEEHEHKKSPSRLDQGFEYFTYTAGAELPSYYSIGRLLND